MTAVAAVAVLEPEPFAAIVGSDHQLVAGHPAARVTKRAPHRDDATTRETSIGALAHGIRGCPPHGRVDPRGNTPWPEFVTGAAGLRGWCLRFGVLRR